MIENLNKLIEQVKELQKASEIQLNNILESQTDEKAKVIINKAITDAKNGKPVDFAQFINTLKDCKLCQPK